MMNNDEYEKCLMECTRECRDRECRVIPTHEPGAGILFYCSVDCEEKCREECREKLKHLIR